VRGLAFATLVLLLASPAHAADEPLTLRMAAIAPDGTGWARELRAFAREVESGTGGVVRIKWYLGGIAGDEPTALERIRRGQLDGAAGALFCGALSPTMAVTRVAGLVRTRPEALHLINRLRPRIDDDFKKRGFVALAMGNFGNDILLLRKRVESFGELQKTRMWMWDADKLLQKQMALMGMNMAPATIEHLSAMYDAGEVDGMFVIPTAALAFQWTTRARYFMELRSTALAACVTVSQKAYDQLSFEQQQALRAAGAKLAIRFEDLGMREDALLLNEAFEKQGIKKLATGPALRAAFLEAANRSRDHLGNQGIAPELLKQAADILSDFRTGRHARSHTGAAATP
jgi:TRAP-type C4-dicarboxylate transport system substrate-binding protein